jgi:hypothetical protein
VLIDPSGLDAVVFCGTNDTCEAGDIDDYSSWVIEYWRQHERIFAGGEHAAFAWLQAAIGSGDYTMAEVLDIFHVGFIDTFGSPEEAGAALGRENSANFFSRGRPYDALEGFQNDFWDLRDASARFIDTLIGFSAGASTIERLLQNSAQHGYTPTAAILIQPFHHFDPHGRGSADGFDNHLRADDHPGTRILTINDPRSAIGGLIGGALNFNVEECGGGLHHCRHEGTAAFGIFAANQPYGVVGDQRIAGYLPLNVGLSYGP